ncbi:MAG: maleylpyruvate isomerase family mycothiol-dependent enzyme [Nocardioides sp.]
MTGLSAETYLHHLAAESRRFRDTLATADPAARVPGCPEWTAADLLWHLAEVQHFWNAVLCCRPNEPEHHRSPPRPNTHSDLLAAFDSWSAELQDTLAAANPKDAAWSWASEQTVGFTLRRQAHEALIHRVDAEQTANSRSDIDRHLAADGVDEILRVFYGGCPDWADFTPGPHPIEIVLTDTADSIHVRPGTFSGTSPGGTSYHRESALEVTAGDSEPSATIAGAAEAVGLWLWKRGDDGPLTMSGDPVAIADFIECVSTPLD